MAESNLIAGSRRRLVRVGQACACARRKCGRNTARSRMAEAWFNRLAAGRGKAESCGTMPAAECDPLVAQVLREVGINFPEQAPRALSQQLLRRSPLVVIVGKEVNSRAFAPIRVWDLPDPTGMTIEHYRLVRDAIRHGPRRRVPGLALELIAELEQPQERISIA